MVCDQMIARSKWRWGTKREERTNGALQSRDANELGLTFEPTAVFAECGLHVGRGYRGVEIHCHRDENEDRRRAPSPYRVVEEQHLGREAPVRTLMHVVAYHQPSLDAYHVQPKEARHE